MILAYNFSVRLHLTLTTLPSKSVGSLLALALFYQPLAVQQISYFWNYSTGLPSANGVGRLIADAVVVDQCNYHEYSQTQCSTLIIFTKTKSNVQNSYMSLYTTVQEV